MMPILYPYLSLVTNLRNIDTKKINPNTTNTGQKISENDASDMLCEKSDKIGANPNKKG